MFLCIINKINKTEDNSFKHIKEYPMKTIPELQKEIDELYAAGSSEALEKRLLEMVDL